MQGWIEQANGHRPAIHDAKQLFKILALHWQDLRQGRAPAVFARRTDHLAHGQNAFFLKEHVLGPAQADPLRPEIERLLGIAWRIRVGTHTEAAGTVGPAHQRCKITGHLRLAHCDGATQHLAGGAVDRENIALGEDLVADRHGFSLVIDPQTAGAGYARPPHAARNDRCVAGHAAARRQNAGCRVHTVNVFRARLDPHQDDVIALRL